MASRRDFLKTLAATLGTAVAAGFTGWTMPYQTVTALLENRGAGAPWWLVAPLQEGSQVGKGWSVASLSPVERGAAVMQLAHTSGRTVRVHLCAKKGEGKGVASSRTVDLLLMDGGRGDKPTEKDLGRVLGTIARRIRRNELAADRAATEMIGRLETHDHRVMAYGPEVLV